MVEVIQTIAGGTLFALPTTLDLNAEIGPFIENAFQTEWEGWSSRKRIKLLRMAWEIASDAFGQRQQVYEKYHAGDPFRIAAAHFAQTDRARSYKLVEEALNTSPDGEHAILDEPVVLAAHA